MTKLEATLARIAPPDPAVARETQALLAELEQEVAE